MLEVDSVLGLILLGLWIFALFDVIAADASEVRNLPKLAWFVLVLLLASVGAVVWLVLGRPRRTRSLDGAGASPVWGSRQGRAPRVSRADEEAELQAHIEARDRMMASWAEEDRRKQEPNPPADAEGAPSQAE